MAYKRKRGHGNHETDMLPFQRLSFNPSIHSHLEKDFLRHILCSMFRKVNAEIIPVNRICDLLHSLQSEELAENRNVLASTVLSFHNKEFAWLAVVIACKHIAHDTDILYECHFVLQLLHFWPDFLLMTGKTAKDIPNT